MVLGPKLIAHDPPPWLLLYDAAYWSQLERLRYAASLRPGTIDDMICIHVSKIHVRKSKIYC